MDSVLRATAIYVLLMLVFRVAGKRSLAEITTFDFVLLLVISEAADPGLLPPGSSLTQSLLLITTLVGLDVFVSVLKQRSHRLERVLDSAPTVLVEDGKPLKDRMDKARVGEDDILTHARQLQGLERMDQIKYAVLERSGGISIVPKQPQ